MCKNISGNEGIDYVICQICGEKLTRIGQSHLNKHNISLKEYKEKYGEESTMCQKLRDTYAIGIKNSSNLQELIKKMEEKYPDDTYLDYSKVNYINSKTKVIMIDHGLDKNGKEYGEWLITPDNLLRGKRHPSRKGEKISCEKILSTDQVIEMFKKAHPNEKLDYSQVEYKGMHIPVKIICRELDENGEEYGEFWQEPNSHIHGHTHKRYGIDKQHRQQRSDTEKFIRKWMNKFPNDIEHYSFEKTMYVRSQEKVIITCNHLGSDGKPHGDFMINPDAFLQGKGCPKCGNILSKAENEIYEYICALVGNDNVIQRDRNTIKPYEIDIYIPSKKLAIEYNGLLWHSDKFRDNGKKYHLNKTLRCNEQGITLFQIFEDEYNSHKELVLDKIANALGCNGDKEKIMARKCTVTEIDNKEAEIFLNKNHIQGYTVATKHIGAYYNDNLIGVMSFKRETIDGNDWNLTRFATDINYRCQGIGSKLFKHFIRSYNPSSIKSFLDRRWHDIRKETLYDKLGFKIDSIEEPDYKYTKNGLERYHKFGFRKQILHKKYGLPLTMTEREMTEKLGYYRIYDCGLIKYMYKAR